MKMEYIRIGEIPAKLYEAENSVATVLAIHGFAGSKESVAIEGLAHRVCPHGVNVLTYDLPAHGQRTEGAEALAAERCIGEIIAAERFIADRFGGKMHAFATSFGAMCLLHRLEQATDSFEKIVLRVPAVNMADSLVTIAKMTDSSFSQEKAEQNGFVITMDREYRIPYRFYMELVQCSCLRESPKWNSGRLLAIWAEQDELVKPTDTAEFLRLNPKINTLCVKGSGHRMKKAQHLAQALDSAAEFLLNGK